MSSMATNARVRWTSRKVLPRKKSLLSRAPHVVKHIIDDELQYTLESMGGGFFACDEHWRFVRLNAEAERLLGIRREEVLGCSHWDVFPLTVGTRLAEEYHKAAGGELRDFENYYAPWDRWFHNRCFPRQGGGMAVFFYDITAQKQAEAARQESERWLDATFESLVDAVIVVTPERRIVRINPAAECIFGYSPEEACGQSTELFHVDSSHYEEFGDHIREAFDRGETARFEFEVKRKSGEVFPSEHTVALLPGDDGAPLGIVSVVRDLTRKKRAEAALERSEARYRDVVESQTELVCRYLPDGRITFANEAYLRYYGLELFEVLGTNFVPRIPAKEQQRITKALQALTPQRPTVSFTHRIIRPTGEIRWQQWTHRAFFNHDDAPREYQAVGQDVTEKLVAERQVELDKKRFELLFELSRMVDKPEREITDTALEAIVAMTSSEIGFVGFNDDSKASSTIVSWSKDAMARCAVVNRPIAFSIVEGGVWAEAIRRQEPVLIEDYPQHPERKGLPEGHVPIRRFANVPIFADGRVAAIAAVANKEEPYDEGDIRILQLIMGNVLALLQRKRSDEALRESEKRFRALVTASSQALYRMSPDWMVMHQLHGGEFLESTLKPNGYWLQQYILPEDQTWVLEVIEDAITEGEVFQLEHRVIRAGGKPGWVASRAVPIRNEAGEIVEWFGAASDITTRMEAEKALQESEARHRAFFLASMDGILLSDSVGNILKANPAACRILGWTEDELRSGGGRMLVDENSSEVQALLRQLALNGSAAGELAVRTKSGQVLPVEVSISTNPFRLVELQACCIFRDISERKRIEKLKQDVERVIRHDIKTPLVGLQALAQIAFENGHDATPLEMYQSVLRSIRQVANLLDSTEKIARMENGGYTPESEWFDLRETFRSILMTLEGELSSYKVSMVLENDINPELGRENLLLHGEEYLIEDMLTNLIKNAVEASPEGSEVHVYCRHEDGQMHIDIRNHGAVPLAFRPRFFEKYASEGKAHGTGLGTHSARLIARAHGGDISMEASNAENFTTVRVRLPCPEPPRLQTESVAPLELGRRVLLAEDTPLVRAVVLMTLDEAQCETTWVDNGQEAVERAEEGEFDLVLIDYRMPRMDGCEAIRRIRSSEKQQGKKRVCIVAMTATVSEQEKQMLLEAGADACLTKPFESEELLELLARIS